LELIGAPDNIFEEAGALQRFMELDHSQHPPSEDAADTGVAETSASEANDDEQGAEEAEEAEEAEDDEHHDSADTPATWRDAWVDGDPESHDQTIESRCDS
jgi:hypothetical protein